MVRRRLFGVIGALTLAWTIAGCGYNSSPRLLVGDGFTVVMPGGWKRVEYPASDKPGVTRTVWSGGHGDDQFLVVVERPASVAPGDVLSDPEFDDATDLQTARLNGWFYVDAREPNLRIDTATGQTDFVRKVFMPGRTVELINERPGADASSPSAGWAAFRDSLTIAATASPTPTP